MPSAQNSRICYLILDALHLTFLSETPLLLMRPLGMALGRRATLLIWVGIPLKAFQVRNTLHSLLGSLWGVLGQWSLLMRLCCLNWDSLLSSIQIEYCKCLEALACIFSVIVASRSWKKTFHAEILQLIMHYFSPFNCRFRPQSKIVRFSVLANFPH